MGKKILLADDSITIQKVIELTFSDEDFDVVTVGNGRLAIERLPEVQPDIVLCDIIMPEKDGYEVCEFIKKSPAFAHIPVLLLTGAFEPFDQERAARVGSNGHLAKPFEPQTLISKVKELLSEPSRGAVALSTAVAPVKQPTSGISAPPAGPLPWTPATVRQPGPTAVAAPAPPPPSAPAVVEPEVTFIPEEPFGGSDIAAASAGETGSAAPAATGDEFYAVVEQAAEEQESEPAAEMESVYVAETDGLSTQDMSAEGAAVGERPAGKAGAPWVQPTVEVSWEDRAQADGEAPEVFTETPVFDEVLESDAGGPDMAALPAVAAQRPLAEPESIPPMFLEYEPGPEPAVAAKTAVRAPSVPPPSPPHVTASPSAADFLEEQGMTFEADDLAPAVAAPGAASARPSISSPPAEEEVSFADVAAAIEPERQSSARPSPSRAAEVPVPAEMVSQIAQRVVGQLSEKVIREVAWEILPDLAEALIKKEIERLTAELKEP